MESIQRYLPQHLQAAVLWTIGLLLLYVAYSAMQKRSKQDTLVDDVPRKANPSRAVMYTPKTLEDDQVFDSIVIGSGIGGLSVASYLAQSRQRHRVLLLEQHNNVGGCCQVFTTNGFAFDTGIHYVGAMGEAEKYKPGLTPRKLIDAAAPKNHPIIFDCMDDKYDTLVYGQDPSSMQSYSHMAHHQKEHLKDCFPDDHAAIDEYFELVHQVLRVFPVGFILKGLPLGIVKFLRLTGLIGFFDSGFQKWTVQRSLQDVFVDLTTNPHLRAALTFNGGDTVSTPLESPFALNALIMHHYGHGAFYPRGGPGNIAKKIIPVITQQGGKVLHSALVRQILVKNGRAVGVELKDGRQVWARRAVISNAGAYNTFKELPPSPLREVLVKKFDFDNPSNKLFGGPTGLSVYIGLNGDHDDDFNLTHSNVWIYPSAESVGVSYDLLGPRALDQALHSQSTDCVLVSMSSGKDSEWKTHYPGKTVLELHTGARWEWFEKFANNNDHGGIPGTRGERYEQVKETLAENAWIRARQALIHQGAKNLPLHLNDAAVHQVATPLSYAHYLRSRHGAFYGLELGASRFERKMFYEYLRPSVSEVPRLYLTGQDVCTNGFAGALSGGWMCAAAVLGLNSPVELLDEIEHNRVMNVKDGETKELD